MSDTQFPAGLSARQAGIGGAVMAIGGIGALAASMYTGSFVGFIVGTALLCAPIGGLAGYLATVGRTETEIRADVDYRLDAPAMALLGVTGVGVGAYAAGIDTLAGVDSMAIAGVGFVGAMTLWGIGSLLVKRNPLEALGQFAMAAGWALSYAGGLGLPFWVGGGLLIGGGIVALAFGAVGDGLADRLRGTGA